METNFIGEHHRRKSARKRSAILLSAGAGLGLCFANQAFAATSYAWQTTTSGGLWSTPGDWSPSEPNGQDEVADFSQLALTTSPTVVHVDGAYTVGGLIFGNTASNADGWTLDNNGTSTNGLTLSTTSGTPTIAVNNSGSGTITATITAALGGSQGFTKTGTSNLTLSGTNSYTGTGTVDGGILAFSGASSLGGLSSLVAGNTTGVASSTTYLDLQGIGTTSLPITLSAPASSSYRSALLDDTGTTVVASAVTLSGSTTSQSLNANTAVSGAATNLTVNGNVSEAVGTTGITFSLRGTATTSIMNGMITAGTDLIFQKVDSGTWVLNSTGNTWGSTKILGGSFKLGIDQALPTTAAVTIAYNSGSTVALDLNGHNQTVPSIVVTGTAATGLQIKNSSATASTLTVNYGTLASADTYAGALVGTLSLSKSGAGTLDLNSTNAYTGATTVSAGTLEIDSSTNSSAAISGTSGVSVGSGATLMLYSVASSGTINLINDVATVSVASGGTLNLNFSSSVVEDVSGLVYNSTSLGNGTYNSSNEPFITGNGSIVVTPEPAGAMVVLSTVGLLIRRRRGSIVI